MGKVFVVLRSALKKDFFATFLLALSCLVYHGLRPHESVPGIALHVCSLAIWAFRGAQASPLLSCGIFVGGTNQMKRHELTLRIFSEICGLLLSFAIFGLYYSFRLPGDGPFNILFVGSLQALRS